MTIFGKSDISATVLTDSISIAGVRMLTYEITYPRIVHSELMTHRALSKNAASSRAIPFHKMKGQLTGKPVRFGQSNPGMQDKGEDYEAFVLGRPMEYEGNDGAPAYYPDEAWEMARADAMFWSEAFFNAGYHKQVYNRLTEAFQIMKTVISGTELPNFFWLRDDDAADPSIAELARVMREAKDESTPTLLKAGEFHLPYIDRWVGEDGLMHYGDIEHLGFDTVVAEYSLQDAIKISTARCAAVSFRNVDYTLEKSLEVYQRLVGDERKHASAFEHQATPMEPTVAAWHEPSVNIFELPQTWQDGVSHGDKQRQLWSGNLRGWVQHRKLIPGENKSEY
jgi:hypothetical protein